MVWVDVDGLLHFDMAAGGVMVEGWALILQSQLFVVGTETNSGAMAFAILHGSNNLRVGMMDGLILHCATDPFHTPVATPIIFERVADLTGDPVLDRAEFERLALLPALAEEGAIPDDLVRRLSPDIGPRAFTSGGEWLLRATLQASLAGGVPGWRENL